MSKSHYLAIVASPAPLATRPDSGTQGPAASKRASGLTSVLSVADLMTRSQPAVPSHIPLSAARKIARLKGADALLVEDEGRLVGFLDSQVLERTKDEQRVADCMSPIRFCLPPTATAVHARDLMIAQGAHSFPVAAGPFLLGTISRAAIERALALGGDPGQLGAAA
jgi:CBS domain-containing protein